ncbi:MAG: SPOR domain-containing protein, partial [Casimicrobium sp.]
KILSVQQIAKLGPAKVAQLTLACAEWGPFNDVELGTAKALLDPIGLGRTLNTRRVDGRADHWIYIPSKGSKAAAERAVAELKRLNVNDTFIIADPGAWQWAISLGAFKTRPAADAYFDEVRTKGVKTAVYRYREQTWQMSSIVLREPQQSTMQKLEEYKSQFGGSTIVTGACPENR